MHNSSANPITWKGGWVKSVEIKSRRCSLTMHSTICSTFWLAFLLRDIWTLATFGLCIIYVRPSMYYVLTWCLWNFLGTLQEKLYNWLKIRKNAQHGIYILRKPLWTILFYTRNNGKKEKNSEFQCWYFLKEWKK